MSLKSQIVRFFKVRGERLDLMQKMLHKTGAIVALQQQRCGENDLRSSVSTCL